MDVGSVTATNITATGEFNVTTIDASTFHVTDSTELDNQIILKPTAISVIGSAIGQYDASGDLLYQFPDSSGSAGQFLSLDNDNNLIWTSGTGGDVTLQQGTNINITEPVSGTFNIATVSNPNFTSLATGAITINSNAFPATLGANGTVLGISGGNMAWVADGMGSGTVTNVATGTGLTGGPITTTGTIAIANTAVTAGSYTNANITVNAQGQITAASNGSEGSGISELSNGDGNIVITDPTGPATAIEFNPNISVETVDCSGITINGKVFPESFGSNGQVLGISSGNMAWVSNGQVNTVVGGTNITVDSTDPVNPVVNLDTTLTYMNSISTIDLGLYNSGNPLIVQYFPTTGSSLPTGGLGIVSNGTNGSNWDPVTGTITAGTGLSVTGAFNSGSDYYGDVTVSLANTAVTPGVYTNTNLTVNAQGQITSAVSGSGAGVVPEYAYIYNIGNQSISDPGLIDFTGASNTLSSNISIDGTDIILGGGKIYNVNFCLGYTSDEIYTILPSGVGVGSNTYSSVVALNVAASLNVINVICIVDARAGDCTLNYEVAAYTTAGNFHVNDTAVGFTSSLVITSFN